MIANRESPERKSYEKVFTLWSYAGMHSFIRNHSDIEFANAMLNKIKERINL